MNVEGGEEGELEVELDLDAAVEAIPGTNWGKYYAQEEGAWAYYNYSTHETTWSLPDECKQLPPGWSCYVADDGSGQLAYIHKETQVTQWERPVE